MSTRSTLSLGVLLLLAATTATPVAAEVALGTPTPLIVVTDTAITLDGAPAGSPPATAHLIDELVASSSSEPAQP